MGRTLTKTHRRLGITLLALFGLIVFLVLTKNYWLRTMGQLLVLDEKIDAPHDIVLILGGEVFDRPKRAAEIVKQGLAKKVVWMRPETGREVEYNLCPDYPRMIASLMTKFGVPGEKFLFYDNKVPVTSTIAEANTFRTFLETEGKDVRSAIIVTSWYHTSRAKKTFMKYLNKPDVKLTMVAAFGETNPDEWWKSETGFLEVYTEYLKWIYHSGQLILGRN